MAVAGRWQGCSFRIIHLYILCIVLFIVIQLLKSETYTLISHRLIKHTCIPIPEEDVCRNVCELATSKGYPCEEQTVQTEDGFILVIHHIPHGRAGYNVKTDGHKQPVFLQHGLLCSAFDWVSNSANQSLAFLMADQGFDVWMGNVRGNTYSRHHIKYQPDSAEFWSWSWDEMARYDLPAMLNHVLNRTAHSQLQYVGHSQGTLIAFAAFSRDPALARKVKNFFALGPVSTIEYMQGPMKALAYITPELKDLFYLLGVRDFLPNSELIKILGSSLCKLFTKFICSDVLFVLCGYDPQQLNQTRLPVYINHAPAGTSVRNMVHFAQMARSGKFQMFDYESPEENMKHYGQITAPLYNASNVQLPVYLYYGEKDLLADPKDVKGLISLLPNVGFAQEIPSWDHLDFVWGLDAATAVYQPIIDIIVKDLRLST